MSSQEAPTPPLPIRKAGYLATKCNVKAASACEGKQQKGVTLAVHKMASKSSVGTVKTSKQKSSAKHGIKKVTKPASKQPAQPTVSEHPTANSEAALADGPWSEAKELPDAEADQSQGIDLGAAQPPANATGTVNLPHTQANYAAPIMQHQAPPAQPSLQQNNPAPADFTQAALPPIIQPQAAQSLALTDDPVHVAIPEEADASGLAQPSKLAEDILLPTAASNQSQVALGRRIWPCSRHVVVFHSPGCSDVAHRRSAGTPDCIYFSCDA